MTPRLDAATRPAGREGAPTCPTGPVGAAGGDGPAMGRRATTVVRRPLGPCRHAPVLLLHGVCSTGPTLDPLAQAFRHGGRTVRAPMLCASARSEAGVRSGAIARLTLDALLDDARRHARALRTEMGCSPVVVGHSNGALLALALAAAGDASGVTLIAPAPPPSVRGAPVWLRRLLFARVFGHRWEGRAIRFDPGWPFASERPLSETLRTLCPDSGPAMAQAMAPDRGSVFDRVSPLPCPALVVAGGHDRLVPPALARGVARALSAAFVLRAGSGHWLVTDRSEAQAICAATLAQLHVDGNCRAPSSRGRETIDRVPL